MLTALQALLALIAGTIGMLEIARDVVLLVISRASRLALPQ